MTNADFRQSIVVGVIALLLYSVPRWANAQEQHTVRVNVSAPTALDGNLWNSLSPGSRALWFGGYYEGYSSGLKMAATFKSIDDTKAFETLSSGEQIHLRSLARYGDPNWKMVSNQEIIDEMIRFYKDPHNLPVCWENAEPIAELTLATHGLSDAELTAIRGEDTKTGCEIGHPSR
jgi:hypothetical protein